MKSLLLHQALHLCSLTIIIVVIIATFVKSKLSNFSLVYVAMLVGFSSVSLSKTILKSTYNV